jgi:DNA polymerase alpha-associated DNA helicase A
MHAQICEFPSKTLYGSKLQSHESVAAHLLRDLPEAKVDSEEDEKDLLGTPVIFYDTAGCEYFERLDGDGDEGSRCNENEAVVVKGWVEQLVRLSSSPPPHVFPVSTDTSVLGSGWCPSFPDCRHHTVSCA